MAQKKTAPAPPSFEQIARNVVNMTGDARQDIERLVGTSLPNVQHYAILGRMDALAADVSRFVADALAAK